MVITRLKTNIEWHNAEHELPENTGYYLVHYTTCLGMPLIMTMSYSSKHKAFNACDWQDNPEHAQKALYWAELPDMPENESEEE